jgi:hypothetical protein
MSWLHSPSQAPTPPPPSFVLAGNCDGVVVERGGCHIHCAYTWFS